MFTINKITRFNLSVFLGVFFCMLSSAILVSAHGVEVVKSDPMAGAVLDQPPVQVKVWFNEELQTSDSTLQVLNTEGIKVDRGNGGVDLDDPDHASMKVDVTTLPVGAYIVKWHVNLTDGDASDGEFSFTIGQPLPAESSYPPPVDSAPKDTISQKVPSISSYPAPDVSSVKAITPLTNQGSTVSSSPVDRWLIPGIVGGVVFFFGIIGLGIVYFRRK